MLKKLLICATISQIIGMESQENGSKNVLDNYSQFPEPKNINPNKPLFVYQISICGEEDSYLRQIKILKPHFTLENVGNNYALYLKGYKELKKKYEMEAKDQAEEQILQELKKDFTLFQEHTIATSIILRQVLLRKNAKESWENQQKRALDFAKKFPQKKVVQILGNLGLLF